MQRPGLGQQPAFADGTDIAGGKRNQDTLPTPQWVGASPLVNPGIAQARRDRISIEKTPRSILGLIRFDRPRHRV
jgi:hypothetical protein